MLYLFVIPLTESFAFWTLAIGGWIFFLSGSIMLTGFIKIRVRRTAAICLAFSIVYLFASYVIFSYDPVLPGLSIIEVIDIRELPSFERRKDIFSYKSIDSKREFSFFASKSDAYVFSVTDKNGESYSIEASVGGLSGLPIAKTIVVDCEIVAISPEKTKISIYANNKKIASRTVNVPIDVSDKRLAPQLLTAGGFFFEAMIISGVSRKGRESIYRNEKERLKITD